MLENKIQNVDRIELESLVDESLIALNVCIDGHEMYINNSLDAEQTKLLETYFKEMEKGQMFSKDFCSNLIAKFVLTEDKENYVAKYNLKNVITKRASMKYLIEIVQRIASQYEKDLNELTEKV